MSDEGTRPGNSEEAGEEEDDKSLFFGNDGGKGTQNETEDDASSDSGKSSDGEREPRTRADSAPILTAVVAFIVIVAIGAAAYFILKPGNGPYDFKGAITSSGQCGGNVSGLQVQMQDGGGKVLAKSALTQKQTGSSCSLNFAMKLPKADNYQMTVALPASTTSSGQPTPPVTLNGPKYTFDELQAKNFTVAVTPTDFSAPSSSGPTPTPAPAPGGGSSGGGSGGGNGGGGNGGGGNGP